MTPTIIDRWIKIASVIASCAVVPGVAWAFQTTVEIHDLRNRAERLDMKIETNHLSNTVVLEEVRAIRSSVEGLRSEILQRVTRVETQIDRHIKPLEAK